MKNKKAYIVLALALIFIISFSFLTALLSNKNTNVSGKLKATILNVEGSNITILDSSSNIYVLSLEANDIKAGDTVVIEYTGMLDELSNNQNIEVISYGVEEVQRDENGIPLTWLDNGIFSDYYVMAYRKLEKLTLDEKIGQLLLVRYPDTNAIVDLKKYKFSGFVFYEKDFKDKTKKEVQTMIDNLQENANIPLLTAVDEEGGRIVRVSSNPALAPSKFKSPQQLYSEGGFEAIKNDTISKSEILRNLGLNLNLAPVVDVSTNPSDYMYDRTLGENTTLTSTYAKTVIEASKNTGVSYTLKHFPGYGNNADTHVGTATDSRSYESILANDLPPFKAGIDVGAEAVLVSHNIVTSIDDTSPATLSIPVHNLLRNNLKFTGVVIADDISMAALNSIGDTTVKAIKAGNNLVITTNYAESFNELKTAVNNGTISETLIDQLAFKVLAWKYSKGLMLIK